jgi:Flp pilus assembly protein TadG
MGSSLRTRLARREEGQALVELSLCGSFLVLVLVAVWQVGTIFSNYIDLSEAARAGARATALYGAPTTSGDTVSLTNATKEGIYAAQQTAPNLMGSAVTANNMKITITAVTAWQAGSDVQAKAEYPYSLTLFGVAITSGTLSVTDDMRVHRQGAS